MKGVRYGLGLLLLALCCTGCLPMRATVSPGAFGVILDQQTRQPLGGAQVVMSREWRRPWPNYGVPTADEALENTRPPLVVTGTNGNFFIGPERKWILDYPPPEGVGQGTLVVTKTGYRPAVVPLTPDSAADVGTILLRPANQ